MRLVAFRKRLFDNDYMTGEVTYKYYNDMMWPERFATCVSVNEAIKMLE